MQTFLPHSDYAESGKVLDRARLGKQRVEGLQILNALAGKSTGWVNHPATKMWRSYEPELVKYVVAICDEWCSRGYSDTCKGKVLLLAQDQGWDLTQDSTPSSTPPSTPDWLGDERVHSSHRSNLLRKDLSHYSQYGWSEPDDMPYFWPSSSA